jgi:hypothetical protein
VQVVEVVFRRVAVAEVAFVAGELVADLVLVDRRRFFAVGK